MINPAILSFLIFSLSSFGLISIYNEWIVLKSSYYLIIGILFAIIYLVIRRTHTKNRKADKLVVLSITFMLVNMLSSFTYYNWKLTNMFSVQSMTKFILVLLTLFALYINFVYIRAEQSYKKKRGNQRIREEPKQGYFEQLRESFRKKQEDENEIVLTLGISSDNEDV